MLKLKFQKPSNDTNWLIYLNLQQWFDISIEQSEEQIDQTFWERSIWILIIKLKQTFT